MERKKFLKQKNSDASEAQRRFNIYQENYDRLKFDENASCPDYRTEKEKDVEEFKLSYYFESISIDTSSKVYNTQQKNRDKLKSEKIPFGPVYGSKNETGVKSEKTEFPNDFGSEFNDNSRKDLISPPCFESLEQEIKNSEVSDLDVNGSASTVSFPDILRRKRYVPKTEREPYPVHVVRPCIVIKKKKEIPKEKFKVVQTGNFFEIVSLTPKSKKLLK